MQVFKYFPFFFFRQLVADPDDSDKTDTTLNSVPLSILLEQIEKGDQPSSEEQSFDLIPNAGRKTFFEFFTLLIAQILMIPLLPSVPIGHWSG